VLAERRQTTLSGPLGVGEWSASAQAALTAAFGRAGDQTAPRQGRTGPACGRLAAVRLLCGACVTLPGSLRSAVRGDLGLAGAGLGGVGGFRGARLGCQGVEGVPVLGENNDQVALAVR